MARLRFECKRLRGCLECKPTRSLASLRNHRAFSNSVVRNFSNVSPINPNRLLSAMLKMHFIFVRREVLFREGGERASERRRGQNRPRDFSRKKWGLVSVYNGLILCRRHCFTIVAHDWKFWQMYFAWKIVLKFYMCICIVLWMYFLILTPEVSVIFLSSRLLYRLFEDFPGTPPALVQAGPYFDCTVYCYVLFFVCSFRRTALWSKQAWSLSGEMHFYLFKSPRWVFKQKGLLSPAQMKSSIYPSSWWTCYDFCTLNYKMSAAWLLWWFSCI